MNLKGFLFFGLLLTAVACGTDNKEAKPAAPVEVQVGKPVGGSQSAIVLSGNVEASQTAMIATRIMGMITQIDVKIGDRVRKGQVLFTVNSDDLRAKRSQTEAVINQAEAQLRNTRKDYDRFTALYKQQSATAKELENVQLQFEAAKANLEAAIQMRNEVDASMGYARVRAPFDGIITAKNAEAGSIANPGIPVLTLENAAGFRVAANVPETEVSNIRVGDSVSVLLNSINRSFPGVIGEINPSSRFNGGQYAIRINIPHNQYGGLYAGLYARVSVVSKTGTSPESRKLLIPVSALVQKDQLTGIYTPGQSHTAVLRWIRIGKKYGEEVEVLSGLDKEETFIVKANGRLYNGAAIEIKN